MADESGVADDAGVAGIVGVGWMDSGGGVPDGALNGVTGLLSDIVYSQEVVDPPETT